MYDSECYKLAERFLPAAAPERLRDALAQHIQTSVEDWLEGEAKRVQDEIDKG
jgi:hypothetical protein